MALLELIMNTPVRQLALREVVTVQPTTTLGEALERMRAARLGCVVLVDPDGKPTGTFTERDLVRLVAGGGVDLGATLDGLRSPAWTSVRENDTIRTLIEKMQEEGIRFVCVCDEEGKAIALTGQRGLMELVADYCPQQVIVKQVRTKPLYARREGA